MTDGQRAIPFPLPDEPLVIGVMSGTSADGIDVAVCQLHRRTSGARGNGSWGRLLAHHAVPYTPTLRARILELRREGQITLSDLAALTRNLTLAHASAVRAALQRLELRPAQVTAIADHGQTVFHAPPLTLQLLDPSLLAAEMGIGVVSDFRRADCAAGGQGAPLVPYADLRLFARSDGVRVLLNLGGIANVTILKPDSPLIAFDTGPANCLSDYIYRSLAGPGCGMDVGGELALQGRCDEAVVERFVSHPFVLARPPKSTDTPAMVAAFVEACRGVHGWKIEDLLATAAACVGASVGKALSVLLGETAYELVASGGGVHNAAICRELQRYCPRAKLLTADALGVPSAAKEAIAFALLGLATLEGRAGNVPEATGARAAVVLGSWTPSPLPALDP